VIAAEDAEQQDHQDNNQDCAHYRSFPRYAALRYRLVNTVRRRGVTEKARRSVADPPFTAPDAAPDEARDRQPRCER
jgi:hypothetical protein